MNLEDFLAVADWTIGGLLGISLLIVAACFVKWRRTPLPKKAREFMIVGSSRVDLQACKLEYSIVSPK